MTLLISAAAATGQLQRLVSGGQWEPALRFFSVFWGYHWEMPNWRRAVVPGGTYFFTVVTD